ncbi:hypothetical protein JHL17_08610 [Azospirillum sp. YIM B02556]|uniref:Uncharacterized protein n=1 Tax=Azospirillum endophyticum TaxID=2800326 RepID=A0ABS1F241_9PROT|nr:hypothetical protein [Azospirillum endophyticum]MBK1837472.1 hypothetical protein [Azospirillum endophyticum]
MLKRMILHTLLMAALIGILAIAYQAMAAGGTAGIAAPFAAGRTDDD